jgi:heme oxygenase
MNLSSTLREVTRPMNRACDETPFSHAMQEGVISRSLYSHLLWELRALHVALDEAMRKHPELVQLYDAASHGRLAALDKDLGVLCPRRPISTVSITQVMVRRFANWSRETPYRLLGAAYVFEQARSKSLRHVHALQRALGVRCSSGQGLDYHLEGRERAEVDWKHFRRELDHAQLDPLASRHVVEGAQETLAGFCQLYRSLGGSRPGPRIVGGGHAS